MPVIIKEQRELKFPRQWEATEMKRIFIFKSESTKSVIKISHGDNYKVLSN